MTALTSTVYAYLDSAWVDISADVLNPLSFEWGINGNKSTDLVADVGILKLELDNSARLYTPGGSAMRTGWKKGVPIVVDITCEGDTFRRFRGIIEDIELDPSKYGKRRAYITVYDYMGYPTKNHLTNPVVEIDQKPEDVIDDIIGQLPINPVGTEYDAGINVIPQSYDTSTAKTKAYTELSKVVDAEVGYLFVKKNRFDGELLVFQGNHTRKGTDSISKIPLVTSASGFMKKEDGDYLLLETGDKIILDQTESATFYGDSIKDMESIYGKDLVNRFILTVDPKTEDGSAAVLFSISEPITMPPQSGGASGPPPVTLRGSYRDLVGRPCAGKDMIDPVATTDYLMNSKADGSGSNLTANLSVTATYSASYVDYRFLSSASVTGYITFLQARGTGIYDYEPIEYIYEDDVSIEEFGEYPGDLQQIAKNDMVYGQIVIKSFVERDKYPRNDLKRVTFVANKSNKLAMAFLSIDVGDVVFLSNAKDSSVVIGDSQTATDGVYYIQSVEAKISGGDIVHYSWGVRQSFNLNGGLSAVAVETDQPAGVSSGVLDFGQLPYLWNVSKRSISFWVEIDGTSSENTAVALISADAGFIAATTANAGTAQVVFTQKGSTTDGVWTSPADSIILNQWNHIAITRDSSNIASSPVIYINGSSVGVTEVAAQVGAITDETGCNLTLNNYASSAIYTSGLEGKLRDVRLYNDAILTSTQAASLYNSGTFVPAACDEDLKPYIQFQAPNVMTSRYTDYVGTVLTDGMNLIDNIYFVIGTPVNTVTGRSTT